MAGTLRESFQLLLDDGLLWKNKAAREPIEKLRLFVKWYFEQLRNVAVLGVLDAAVTRAGVWWGKPFITITYILLCYSIGSYAYTANLRPFFFIKNKIIAFTLNTIAVMAFAYYVLGWVQTVVHQAVALFIPK